MMSKAYKFSDFILDKQTIAVYHHNIQIQISSRAFEILYYLIERRGEVVEKDEILERVWKDSFVEEANLPVHISAIRRVLQEKKGESRYIRTISGRGYSFIANVEEINSTQIYQPSGKQEVIEKENISIAVLPFTFESSAEDNEYLANGITQSLINDLSQIQNLRVLAYSAVKPYKNSELELQEIGFLLDSDKILTGSISEYKGKLEITVELINASDKRCLWGISQVFEADDIFKVKKEISLTITEMLKPKLGDSKLIQKKEIDSKAQKLYYRGKFILESRTTKKQPGELLPQALKFFNQAVNIEPNYALAHTGIGSVYVSLHNHNLMEREESHIEAKKSLQKALDTNHKLSEVYILKGSIELMFEWNFSEAESSFNKATELNPNNPDSYHWKSILSICLGRFEDALSLEETAVSLDPTSIRFNENLTRIFYYSGNYEKAIIQADEMLEFDELILCSHMFKALSYAQTGFFDLASASIEKAITVRKVPDIILNKSFIYALSNRKEDAQEFLDDVLLTYPISEIDSYDIAKIYSAMNEIDKSFQYLLEAYENRSVGFLYLGIDVRLKELWNDKRFDRLVDKLNIR
jgi:DNA-binding winged helix-turn-helix (wHTH) protein/Flp pilus assembly protein TadD